MYKIIARGSLEKIVQIKQKLERKGEKIVIPDQLEFPWEDWEKGVVFWFTDYLSQGLESPIHYLVKK